MNDPLAEYARRLARWNERIERHDRTHFFISNCRLVVALLFALVAIFAVRGAISFGWLVVPSLAFGILVVVHAMVLQRGEHARRAARFSERGVARLKGQWAGQGRDGARFLDSHPYARDLDLFGRGSLFELLNSTRTEVGEQTLAAWLGAGAAVEEVRARQVAVDELRPMLDFREDLAVLADEAQVGQTGALLTWAGSRPVEFAAMARALFIVCGLVTAVIAVLAFQNVVESSAVFAWVLVESVLVLSVRRQVQTVLGRIDLPEHDLTLLAGLLRRIERETFQSPRLSELHAALAVDGVLPSRDIARLRQLVSWLDSTRNILFGPIAYAILLREQLAFAINHWHATHGPAVAEWVRIAGEIEALASFGAYAYERPTDPFPDLVERGPVFDAVALGHPLIDDTSSVRNDVQLGLDRPHVLVVSGSNMSGKSTLLRAVGANVVLGLAGAPVHAASVRLSFLAIGATLKVEDSLQEGHSRFYTEILRIRAIVDIARAGKPLLFLLDEILHGTNSYDRRIGAEAIVRALVSLGAIGLVTTHDLALTELVATLRPVAANVHFEDRIEDGRMVFDYKMRPGVVERSNALALMRAVGLDV